MTLRVIFLFCFFSIATSIDAEIVTAIQNGFWSDTLTWSNNSVPKPDDSVFINKYVWADTSIVVNKTGLLFIDLCGTLCGSQFLYGSFTNYGNIYLDSTTIIDSAFNYGFFTFTYHMLINGLMGGRFYSCCGGYGNVGSSPNCNPAPPRDAPCSNSVLAIKETEPVNAIRIYPNPFSDFLVIENEGKNGIHKIDFMNIDGTIAKEFVWDGITKRIETANLPAGIYFVRHGKTIV